MPGNANMQRLGKRKAANPLNQPDWLFPPVNDSVTANSQQEAQSRSKQEKKLADELLRRRASGEPPKSIPSTELVALVEAFLVENEFIKTTKAFTSERKSKGAKTDDVQVQASLGTIFYEWRALKNRKIGTEVKGTTSESFEEDLSSSSSSASYSESEESEKRDVEMKDAPQIEKGRARKTYSSSSSSSASSSSDSDGDDRGNEKSMANIKPTVQQANSKDLKRKAPSRSDSSSSGSGSSSEDEGPKMKKKKVRAASSSESSGSHSTSTSGESLDSDSSSSSEASEVKATNAIPPSAASASSSEEDSSSDSDSSTDSAAQKVPLPDSASESSDPDSDLESHSELGTVPAAKKSIEKHVASDTSATLSDAPNKAPDSSSDPSSSDSDSNSSTQLKATKIAATLSQSTVRKLSPPLPPAPVIKAPNKVNIPFSRIPQNIKVEGRFASNAYIPNDYAQKAHEDLIITKGKSFTKEKNKKKRGSYRGGYIDVEGKKGIKFED